MYVLNESRKQSFNIILCMYVVWHLYPLHHDSLYSVHMPFPFFLCTRHRFSLRPPNPLLLVLLLGTTQKPSTSQNHSLHSFLFYANTRKCFSLFPSIRTRWSKNPPDPLLPPRPDAAGCVFFASENLVGWEVTRPLSGEPPWPSFSTSGDPRWSLLLRRRIWRSKVTIAVSNSSRVRCHPTLLSPRSPDPPECLPIYTV
jgi:hypothetical protein